MRLKRVGRYVGVVAPHFRRAVLASNRLAAGAVEIFQDVGLFSVRRIFRSFSSIRSFAAGRNS